VRLVNAIPRANSDHRPGMPAGALEGATTGRSEEKELDFSERPVVLAAPEVR
jgi:hypothetical protein